MATDFKKLLTQRNGLIALAVLFAAYVGFNEMRKAEWRRKLRDEIASLDSRIGSGRLSAAELVELNQRKKAILQEYLKSI